MSIVLILGISYLVGVNIAGFTLLHIQKKERAQISETLYRQEQQRLEDEEKLRLLALREESKEETQEKPELLPDPSKEDEKEKKKEVEKVKKQKSLPDLSLLIIAATGGALSIYLGMFLMKYKLKNLLFLLVIPLCIGLNVWLALNVFTVWFVI